MGVKQMRKLVGIILLLILPIFLFMLSGCETAVKADEREIYVPVLADAAWLFADGAFISGVNLALEEMSSEYAGKEFVLKTAVIDDQALYETGVEKELSWQQTIRLQQF